MFVGHGVSVATEGLPASPGEGWIPEVWVELNGTGVLLGSIEGINEVASAEPGPAAGGNNVICIEGCVVTRLFPVRSLLLRTQ